MSQPIRIKRFIDSLSKNPKAPITFGRYKGSTLEQVRTEDYNYYNWFMTSVLKK